MAQTVDSMKEKIRAAQRQLEIDLKTLERDARRVEEDLERVIKRFREQGKVP